MTLDFPNIDVENVELDLPIGVGQNSNFARISSIRRLGDGSQTLIPDCFTGSTVNAKTLRPWGVGVQASASS